jgi:hypothetical protein
MESFISERFAKMEDAAQVFDTWKPTIDASVKELRLEIGAIRKSEEAVEKMREEMMVLRKTVSCAALDAGPSTPAGILHQPGAVFAPSSTGKPATTPCFGPRVELRHRGLEHPVQSPIKGTILISAATFHTGPVPLPRPFPGMHRSLSGSVLEQGGRMFQVGDGPVREQPRRDHHGHGGYDHDGYHHSNSKLPKFNFRGFDGKNPKLWISCCEDYFEMYFV